MKDLERVLKTMGRKIVWDMRKGAKPNKKTGTLDKSIDSKVSKMGDTVILKVEQAFYGKYLNSKTNYIDKVIDKRIPELTDRVIEVMVDEVLEQMINLETN